MSVPPLRPENRPSGQANANRRDVRQFRRRACLADHRLQKATLLACLPTDKLKDFFNGLDDSKWHIVSFSPYTKEVCVTFTTDFGNRTISVILPQISSSGIKGEVFSIPAAATPR